MRERRLVSSGASSAERRRRELPGENRYSAFARHRTYMRVEANADKVGLTIVGGAAVGVGAHAAWSFANRKKFDDTEGDDK